MITTPDRITQHGGTPDSTSFGTRTQSVPVQQPSPMPYGRYRPFPPIDLPDRT